MKLRQRIQFALRASGMSQAELARACGIDKGNLSRFLSGRGESSMISVTKLERVLDHLGLSLNYEYGSAIDQPGWLTQVNLSYALLRGKIKGVPDEDLHRILVARFQPIHERSFILKKIARSYAI
jgi:transcriptional regulator with XRE-family HTH domain